MQGIVRAMANTLFRTGRSGVLATGKDFSACIVTHDDQLLAAAESLPIHILSGPDLVARDMREQHEAHVAPDCTTSHLLSSGNFKSMSGAYWSPAARVSASFGSF